MTTIIELLIPFPPSANHIWVRAQKGMRLSERYKKWIEDAGWHIKTQPDGLKQIKGPYNLTIHAHRPDKRHRDLDNIFKPVQDLLQRLSIIEDDRYCEMISARWVTDGEGVYVRLQSAGTE